MKVLVLVVAFLLSGCSGITVIDGHYNMHGHYIYDYHDRHYHTYYTPSYTFIRRVRPVYVAPRNKKHYRDERPVYVAPQNKKHYRDERPYKRKHRPL